MPFILPELGLIFGFTATVLDITCLHMDYGQGPFVSSARGEILFALLYLAWLAVHGCPETVITDRGSDAENDTLVNALRSMGIHWRVAPTEAPWCIGLTERHHGPDLDAYGRVMAEMPALAHELGPAMAYKARNAAPGALGVAPTTAVTGQPPRLLIGDNAHTTPSVAERARATLVARATVERYTAAERLRGALFHPATVVPYVEVGQDVIFHR